MQQHRRRTGSRSGPARWAAAGLGAAVALPLLGLPGAGAAARPSASSSGGTTAPAAVAEGPRVSVYEIVQEGLTLQDATRLAEAAKVGLALRPDGSFAFTDPQRYGRVPSIAGRKGVDEHRRPTLARTLDVAALRRVQVPQEGAAIEAAQELLRFPAGYQATPVVGHTTVTQSDRRGKVLRAVPIDTTVSFRFTLGNLPVVGPGAKAKVAFDSRGVVALNQALRRVDVGDSVPVITQQQAQARCGQLYPRGTRQLAPTLAYYAPALSAAKASGRGTARLLAPQYVCRPVLPALVGDRQGEQPELTGRLVPAAPSLSPALTASASTNGKAVKASVAVRGGTAPYAVRWSSSSTSLAATTASVGYRVAGRRPARPEVLTVTVTDANGTSTTARLALGSRAGVRASAKAVGAPGGSGGDLARVGIEQTVDEWQCAQDSAIGFRSVMQARSHQVAFDWRGASAFEKDFKRSSLGGWDNRYVDAVDAQWYTGHGNSGGFTFKSNVDDGSITPSEARWGDGDLEWMQLESCQVLRDTNGADDYFGRWGQVFDGLHLLNGFDTNATCVNGGTGRRFAGYLFPETFLWWTTRPALTVQQAWARTADELEPAGTRWRTISAAGPGWVTNLDDHFWGQGTVGPDIRGSQLIGWVAVSGVS